MMNRSRICLIALLALSVSAMAGELWKAHVIEDIHGGGPDGVRLADVNADGLMDVTSAFEYHKRTMVFLHPGTDKVRNDQPWPSVQVQSEYGSGEDSFFADFDADGRMDVLTSCEGSTDRLVISWAPAKEHYLNADRWQVASFPAGSLVPEISWIYSLPMDVNGDGHTDIVAGGMLKNAEIGWLCNPGPDQARDLSKWTYHKITDCRWTMHLQGHDFNGDGLEDLLLTDHNFNLSTHTPGGIAWLEHPGRGQESQEWKVHTIRDAGARFASLVDVTGDGKPDILAAGTGAKVAWYEQGKADADGNPTWIEHVFTYDNPERKAKDLDAADIDGDGQIEFILTSETQIIDPDGPREASNLDKANVIYLESTTGDVYAKKWSRHEISGNTGKLDLIELYDFDGDGDLDIMTTDESGQGVIWWENPTVVPAADVMRHP